MWLPMLISLPVLGSISMSKFKELKCQYNTLVNNHQSLRYVPPIQTTGISFA